LTIKTRYKIFALPDIKLLLKDSLMTDPLDLQCSDDLFQSLIEASHCSFILLALRRYDRPLRVSRIASLLFLNIKHSARLLDMLIRFGFILPVNNWDEFTITPSGIDLISPKPVNQPWDFEPTLQLNGDRLPTYVAFDLLPLRIYSYRRTRSSSGNDNAAGRLNPDPPDVDTPDENITYSG
jgi:hypothetical protein